MAGPTARTVTRVLLALVALVAPLAPWSARADETPSPAPSATVGATATSLAGLSAPVRSFSAPTLSIVTTVQSVDGAQTQEDTATKRTLILDSRVLFAEDRAVLTPPARQRLRAVARQIRQSRASGIIRVDGYTDDQGSAQHGLVLSRARAAAVRRTLAPLLRGAKVSLATRGLGEAHPRFPNRDKAGNPIPANQAKNRRVEISFSPGR